MCKCHARYAGLTIRRLNFHSMQNLNKRNAKGLLGYYPLAQRPKNYFLGRFAPYLERDWLRSFTPAQSKEPRTV